MDVGARKHVRVNSLHYMRLFTARQYERGSRDCSSQEKVCDGSPVRLGTEFPA